MSARSLLTLSALLASSALATPTLDPQFGDHAMIQRGKPVLLGGTANPRERVTASLGGDTKTVTADANGRWSRIPGPSRRRTIFDQGDWR